MKRTLTKRARFPIKGQFHAELFGPDGKIKDERTPETLHKKEVDNEKNINKEG